MFDHFDGNVPMQDSQLFGQMRAHLCLMNNSGLCDQRAQGALDLLDVSETLGRPDTFDKGDHCKGREIQALAL